MKLRDRAYESFTSHLLAQRIQPGQFVTQRELVALTGLPLGAIRELIPRLEAEGLLVTLPQRGMQIAGVDVKLVRNAFQLRLLIEKEAVARFTETASAAEIEAHDAALRRVIRDAERGVTARLLAQAQAADWGFHDAIVDALDNELIAKLHRVNSIRIRVMRHERVTLSPEVLPTALAEHASIMGAIRARDVAGAVVALERHLSSARNRVLGLEALDGGRLRPPEPIAPATRRRAL